MKFSYNENDGESSSKSFDRGTCPVADPTILSPFKY